jgi:hypothetical protein
MSYLDDSEPQHSAATSLGDSTSAVDDNNFGSNIFAEINATPTNDPWADLNLDLNNDWGLFKSVLE